MKRVIRPLFLLLALWGRSVCASPPQNHPPTAAGTFIQSYLVKEWTDTQWQSELGYLKQVGMRFLVLEPTVDSKARVAYYPTHLSGYTLASGYTDIVDACLRNAEKAGVQVFLGLNFDEDWWRKEANDPAWLYAQMDAGNAVADELYHNYFRRYPHAFHGWYWVWEADNANFQTVSRQDVLAQALDRNVRHLHRLAPKLPVLLCPFMNSQSGTPQAYQKMWEYVFAHTALGSGDIFCPQDSVGAKGLKLEEVSSWFKALGQAVATKPGLRFWSDTETFDQSDWTRAPLNRFVAQLKAVQPYVEKSLTFAYSHYYSPNIAPIGFQRTYLKYLQSGQLESIPPTPPGLVAGVRQADGSVKLSWTPAKDNIGICGYYVFRQGVRISRLQTGRNAVTPSRVVFVDSATSRKKCEYTLQAYDFAGNVSTSIAIVVP